ncbi:ELMO domain-containing protein, putative [Pediculus humanus corporis]|uniref:ELMO domain-containing protein, putative n=1 Tax=Pediculus humanus subsp. corporis TaxID=121224 RepID=E0VMA2_PEDHC|nr:ELMO domain-containing protein, putative [Pediculus humanus corporis]EEB14508.1 ELMO domain-containing protein, putative [Pediculus humanus corporis]
MMISFHSVLQYIYWYIRPIIKWFLRKTTKLCELQRICYGEVSGAPRTLAVEASLLQSRNPSIRELHCYQKNHNAKSYRRALQHGLETVIRFKKINPQVHIRFFMSFAKCLEQIWSYDNLVRTIEELRRTNYDFSNENHEKKLLKLWNLLVPDVKLNNRVTKQWQFIGFQGDDPKTDFRGMGILGLENLLFFASEYSNIAQKILLKSQHPTQGYAFAIVGINLTHLTYHLVKDGAAKTHMFNATRSPLSIRTFHQLYSYLYIEFDHFWTISKPNNIMDFSFIRDKFEKNIREELKNPLTLFKVKIVVDDV